MISRREFLRAATGALAAVPLIRAEQPGGAVGTQLYGWGQYYEREGSKVYEHLDEVFAAIRDCGYDYAEGSLDIADPQQNVRFAEKLKANGLRPVALYTGGRLHETPEQSIAAIVAAAKSCADAGFRIINCNPDPIGRPKTEAELKTQAEALDRLGRELNKLGLKLGVHNHTPEMQNNAREFHHNFAATNPAHVGFCYDVHWVYRGGIRPVEVLKQYGARIVSWHLRQSREGIWWEDLAPGDIDYEAVAAYSKEHKLPAIYSVELAIEKGTKITRTVMENHRRSREFVKKVFGI